MINKTVKILWIDDEKERNKDAKNITYNRKYLRIEVLHPKSKKMKERLVEIENKKNLPDIFLIDYFLDLVPEEINGEKYHTRALALAGKIRELVPEYPIYVITNKETDKKGIFFSETQAAKTTFEKILILKDVLREGHNILYYDALDFKRLRESTRNDLSILFELLEAPEDIKERIKLVIPDELKEGLAFPESTEHPEGNAIQFAKWVQYTFLTTPGFVYDKLHAATHMGLNVESFEKISPKLNKAKYSGIFSKTNEDVWWVSMLNNIIFSYKKAQKSNKTNPWEVAPIIFNISDKDRSKCAVCGGFFPETVGINLKDEKDLKPVHYKCSRPHPLKRRILYFDESRAFEV